MRIVLNINEAIRKNQSGLENHQLQLIHGLSKCYDLDAIIQTNRRVSLFVSNQAESFTCACKRRLKETGVILKILLCAKRRTLTFYKFKKIEPNDVSQVRFRLSPILYKFKKIYFNDYFYDACRWLYIYTGRQSLYIIPPLKNADIFWQTSPYPIYMKGVANVCTIHDTFFNSEKLSEKDSLNTKKQKLQLIMSHYDIIFTVSEYTKKLLIDLFPEVNRKKIFVTYQAFTKKTELMPELTEEKKILAELKLQKNTYLFHVGTLVPRKNHLRLIAALNKLETNIPLILVGKKSKFTKKQLVIEIEKNNRVIYLGHVSNAILNVLYKNALAFVFPSTYEGFGLPILEAFYHHCPVITSNKSAIPEVAGDAVTYVDPYSITDISKGITSVINNQTLRTRQVERGIMQLEKFTDEFVLNNIKKAFDAYYSTVNEY
jgi:glycosyltransferase involved in cell wall biosynthesis